MPRGRPRKNAAAAPPATPAAPRGRANNRPQAPFTHKRVLIEEDFHRLMFEMEGA